MPGLPASASSAGSARRAYATQTTRRMRARLRRRNTATCSRAPTNFSFAHVSTCSPAPRGGVHLAVDIFDRLPGTEHGAFLPARHEGRVIAGELEAPLRLS